MVTVGGGAGAHAHAVQVRIYAPKSYKKVYTTNNKAYYDPKPCNHDAHTCGPAPPLTSPRSKVLI